MEQRGHWVELTAQMGEGSGQSKINPIPTGQANRATRPIHVSVASPPATSPLPYDPLQLSLASVSVQHGSIPQRSAMGMVPTVHVPGPCGLYLTHGALPVCQLVE